MDGGKVLFPSRIPNSPGVCSAAPAACRPLRAPDPWERKTARSTVGFPPSSHPARDLSVRCSRLKWTFIFLLISLPPTPFGKPHAPVKTSSCQTPNAAPPRCPAATGGAQGRLEGASSLAAPPWVPGAPRGALPASSQGALSARRCLLRKSPVTNRSLLPPQTHPDRSSCLALPAGARSRARPWWEPGINQALPSQPSAQERLRGVRSCPWMFCVLCPGASGVSLVIYSVEKNHTQKKAGNVNASLGRV